MQIANLRPGEAMAGVGGVGLAICTLLTWYAGKGGQISTGVGQIEVKAETLNAWQAFTYLDAVLFLLVVGALVLVAVAASGSDDALRSRLAVVVGGGGSFTTVLVLYRILNQPGDNAVIDVRLGAYAGFGLCALVALGGLLAMQADGRAARLRQRPVAAEPPEV